RQIARVAGFLERHPISSNRRFPAASLIGEIFSLLGGKLSLFDRVGKCHRERRIPRRSRRSEPMSGTDSRISLIFCLLTGIQRRLAGWTNQAGSRPRSPHPSP